MTFIAAVKIIFGCIAQCICAFLHSVVNFESAHHREWNNQTYGFAQPEIIRFAARTQPAGFIHALICGSFQIAVNKELLQFVGNRLQHSQIKPQQGLIPFKGGYF